MTPSEQSYREIPLTQGQVALVDAADYEWLTRYHWHAHWAQCINGFYGRMNVAAGVRKQATVLMHRFILGITDPHVKVDHEDHDGLNCRRCNLRVCTTAQNNQNRRTNSNNKSGYKGVFWAADRNKWRGIIYRNSERFSLGYGDDREALARAYDRKAIELFGEFAHTNFPLSDYQDVLLTTRTLPD